MKPSAPRTLVLLSSLLLSLSPVFGQLRTSPVGVQKFACPGGSDTVVSVPFHQAPLWKGTLTEAPIPAGSDLSRIRPRDFPFAEFSSANDPLYVHFLPGSQREGILATVASIDPAGESINLRIPPSRLAGAAPGDRLALIPAWTLNTLFPPAAQTTFHPSTGRLLPQRGSELLLFDESSSGINLSAPQKFFLHAGGWLDGATFAPAGGTEFLPGHPFIVRHPPGSQDTEFAARDLVFMNKVSLPIRQRSGGPQDTALALPRPVATKLSQLGLSASIFKDSASTLPEHRKDQLLLFDNTDARINKRPSAVFFRTGGRWVQDVPGYPGADNTEVSGGAGLLIRKDATTQDGTVVWTNLPNY